MRKEPPEANGMCAASAGIVGLEEEGDEPADEAVEEAGLGEREAEPLVTLDVGAQLGLTGLGLDRGAEHGADAGTGTRGAASGARAERNRATGVLRIRDARRRERDHGVEHGEDAGKHGGSTTPSGA